MVTMKSLPLVTRRHSPRQLREPAVSPGELAGTEARHAAATDASEEAFLHSPPSHSLTGGMMIEKSTLFIKHSRQMNAARSSGRAGGRGTSLYFSRYFSRQLSQPSFLPLLKSKRRHFQRQSSFCCLAGRFFWSPLAG